MLCSSFRPALLLNGYEEQTVDTWLRNAQQELRNGVHRLNARVRTIQHAFITTFAYLSPLVGHRMGQES